MKRILIIWKDFYPWDVRIEKFCKSLSKNYKVGLLCRWNHGQKEYEFINGYEIFRVNYFDKPLLTIPLHMNPFWTKSIEKKIFDFKPDLIIVREMLIAKNVGVIANKHNIPVIMDMAENYPAAMRLWKKYNSNLIIKSIVHDLKLPDYIERESLKHMNGVITVCDEQIERLNSLNYHGKTKVIFNTPPEKKLQIKSIELVDDRFITIGHHGWLSMDKDIGKFIEVFIDASKQNKRIKLRIAGVGECYQDYLLKYGSENSVEFLGEYSYHELGSIISEMTFGVLPYEPNGFNNYTIQNKIFDYFQYGKPVIVSNATPLKRVIEETGAGLSYNYYDQNDLYNLLVNLNLNYYQKFSNNALLVSKEKYNWNIDEENLFEFIEEFI